MSAVDEVIQPMKLAGLGFDADADGVDIAGTGLRELGAGHVRGGKAVGVSGEEISIDGMLGDFCGCSMASRKIIVVVIDIELTVLGNIRVTGKNVRGKPHVLAAHFNRV